MQIKNKLSDVNLSKHSSKRAIKHPHRNEAALWQKKQRRKVEKARRKTKQKLIAARNELAKQQCSHQKELFLARLDGKLSQAVFWMEGASL